MEQDIIPNEAKKTEEREQVDNLCDMFVIMLGVIFGDWLPADKEVTRKMLKEKVAERGGDTDDSTTDYIIDRLYAFRENVERQTKGD